MSKKEKKPSLNWKKVPVDLELYKDGGFLELQELDESDISIYYSNNQLPPTKRKNSDPPENKFNKKKKTDHVPNVPQEEGRVGDGGVTNLEKVEDSEKKNENLNQGRKKRKLRKLRKKKSKNRKIGDGNVKEGSKESLTKVGDTTSEVDKTKDQIPTNDSTKEDDSFSEVETEKTDQQMPVNDTEEGSAMESITEKTKLKTDMSQWDQFGLHPLLLKGLQEEGFTNPTVIQQMTLPHGLVYQKDIIGAAETGSGKTLAFGLPILHQLIQHKESVKVDKAENQLSCLILSPTRELSLQIVHHLQAVAKYSSVLIVPIVGGISMLKQERQLSMRPDIIVATPGRFWEMSQNHPYIKYLSNIRFLVIDEADRMIERGHFRELQNIIDDIQVYDPKKIDENDKNSEKDKNTKNSNKNTENDKNSEKDKNSNNNTENDKNFEKDKNTKNSNKNTENDKNSNKNTKNDKNDNKNIKNDKNDNKNIKNDNKNIKNDKNNNKNVKNDESSEKTTKNKDRTTTKDKRIQYQNFVKEYMEDFVHPEDLKDSEDSENLESSEDPEDLLDSEKSENSEDEEDQENSEYPENLKTKVLVKETSLDQDLQEILDSEQKTQVLRQTFIFSATLTLTVEGRKKLFALGKKKKKFKLDNNQDNNTMDRLLELINFRRKVEIVDASNAGKITAETLTESKIQCLLTEKNIYLYYFFLRYPGRTLVFVNSISCIRRLVSIFEILKMRVWGIHAQMQQRQRLKNLDRFKRETDSILVSTDVLARGLDIHDIDHVIHYQVPVNAEIYIHRSGRTARAQASGISVMLVSPGEVQAFKRISNVIGKNQDLIPDFPVDTSYLSGLQQRLDIAMKIDQEMKVSAKTKSSGSWYAKQAKILDIDLDDELLAEVEGDEDNTRQRDEKLNSLKLQLKALIDKPIVPKGISPLYPTRKKFETLGLINEVKHNAIEDFLKNPTPKSKNQNTPEKPKKPVEKIETAVTPPQRTKTPPKRTVTPPKRTVTLPKRSATPPKRSATPPKRSATPPKRSVTPPTRSVTPPKRSATPPKRSVTPPKKGSSGKPGKFQQRRRK